MCHLIPDFMLKDSIDYSSSLVELLFIRINLVLKFKSNENLKRTLKCMILASKRKGNIFFLMKINEQIKFALRKDRDGVNLKLCQNKSDAKKI